MNIFRLIGWLNVIGCTPVSETSPSIQEEAQLVSPSKKSVKHAPSQHRTFIFDPTNHKALHLLSEQQYAEAIPIFQDQLRRYPSDGFARMMLAWTYTKIGDEQASSFQREKLSRLRQGTLAYWAALSDAERQDLLVTYAADICRQNGDYPCPMAPETVPPQYPMFEQMAWVSHREDRLRTWLMTDTDWNVLTVAKDIGLKVGMSIADVGAGEGWFSVPFAEVVGQNGQVYGVEIDQSYIEGLQFLSTTLKLPQLQTIQSTPQSASLPKGQLDIVFVCEVMKAVVTDQQVLDDPNYYNTVALPFVQSLVDGLQPTGRLVFIEHDMPEGGLKGTSEALLRRLITDVGFEVVERGTQYGPLQLLLIAEAKQ